MKKVIALLVSVAILLSLTACGARELVSQYDHATERMDSNLAKPSAKNDQTTPTKESRAEAPTESPQEVPTEEPETEAATGSNNDNANSTGIRPDFKEAMDAYEAFYDEYCAFMVKYQENPTDMTLLLEYSNLMTKAVEMDEAFEKWESEDLNNEELKYYLEVNNRVMQKMLDVIG